MATAAGSITPAKRRPPLAADGYERFLALGATVLLAAVLVALVRGRAQWALVPPLVWAQGIHHAISCATRDQVGILRECLLRKATATSHLDSSSTSLIWISSGVTLHVEQSLHANLEWSG